MKRRDFLVGAAAAAIAPSLPILPEAVGPEAWAKKISEVEWEIVLPGYSGFSPNAWRATWTSDGFEVVRSYELVDPVGGSK
jgi:hypothetical protein